MEKRFNNLKQFFELHPLEQITLLDEASSLVKDYEDVFDVLNLVDQNIATFDRSIDLLANCGEVLVETLYCFLPNSCDSKLEIVISAISRSNKLPSSKKVELLKNIDTKRRIISGEIIDGLAWIADEDEVIKEQCKQIIVEKFTSSEDSYIKKYALEALKDIDYERST